LIKCGFPFDAPGRSNNHIDTNYNNNYNVFVNLILFVSFFTFLIHLTESLAYSIRFAGLRTRQIAIAMSFVTSTLLVSRLSNMFQAPLLGNMVDTAIKQSNSMSIDKLQMNFRIIIFAAALGTFVGILLTPTFINIFNIAIKKFLIIGSLPKMAIMALKPRNIVTIVKCIRMPYIPSFKNLRLGHVSKTFLFMNLFVTSIYTIGVLCALYAGAKLPHLRATAVQLSGIVNGIATILLTLVVDPEGARVTDQAVHEQRPPEDVKTVVISLLFTKFIGTLVVAQLFFIPASFYIIKVTEIIEKYFS